MFSRLDSSRWDDRPLWIIGGGPSIKGLDLSGLGRLGRVLGVNRAPELVSCDAMFTLDHVFVEEYADRIASWPIERYVAVADDWFDRHDAIPGVWYVRRTAGRGIGSEWAIANGLNSGYGALCLGILKGARDIRLLGYDLNPLRDNAPAHWHDGYDWGGNRSPQYFERWALRFADIAREIPDDVQVTNLNPASAVRAFPRCDPGLFGVPEAAKIVEKSCGKIAV